jgi:hypothetical protein
LFRDRLPQTGVPPMTDIDFNVRRYSQAELMRMADAERAKYLRALFKRLFARLSNREVAPATARLSGAKA